MDILITSCSIDTSSQDSDTFDETTDNMTFSNAFEGLDIHEFSDKEVDSWMTATPNSTDKPNTDLRKKEWKLARREEDIVLEWSAFFQGMNDIRKNIRDLWVDFKHAKVDVVVRMLFCPVYLKYLYQ